MLSTLKTLIVFGAISSTLLITLPTIAKPQGEGKSTSLAQNNTRKTDTPTPEQIEKMIVALIDLTNSERAKHHLPPLKRQEQLEQAAKWMAQDMSTRSRLSHTDSKKRSIDPRLPDFGYKDYQTIGENIATGQTSAASVFSEWMKSAEHRENILNPEFKEIGVGLFYAKSGNYYWYWVQDFGRQLDK